MGWMAMVNQSPGVGHCCCCAHRQLQARHCKKQRRSSHDKPFRTLGALGRCLLLPSPASGRLPSSPGAAGGASTPAAVAGAAASAAAAAAGAAAEAAAPASAAGSPATASAGGFVAAASAPAHVAAAARARRGLAGAAPAGLRGGAGHGWMCWGSFLSNKHYRAAKEGPARCADRDSCWAAGRPHPCHTQKGVKVGAPTHACRPNPPARPPAHLCACPALEALPGHRPAQRVRQHPGALPHRQRSGCPAAGCQARCCPPHSPPRSLPPPPRRPAQPAAPPHQHPPSRPAAQADAWHHRPLPPPAVLARCRAAAAAQPLQQPAHRVQGPAPRPRPAPPGLLGVPCHLQPARWARRRLPQQQAAAAPPPAPAGPRGWPPRPRRLAAAQLLSSLAPPRPQPRRPPLPPPLPPPPLPPPLRQRAVPRGLGPRRNLGPGPVAPGSLGQRRCRRGRRARCAAAP